MGLCGGGLGSDGVISVNIPTVREICDRMLVAFEREISPLQLLTADEQARWESLFMVLAEREYVLWQQISELILK